MTEKHVTLTLEEADEVASVCQMALEFSPRFMSADGERRFRITAQKIRQRWLDALRKESA